MKIDKEEILQKLEASGQLFLELFHHGSLSVEIYKPSGKDLQQPHDRDEIYVVISGEGTFYSDGQRYPFKAGDFMFVPAGIEHRFEDFTADFSTWVFFYGPVGGEAEISVSPFD